MGNLELLERAFDIAESGQVENVDELRHKLSETGVPISALEQFKGTSLMKQLSDKISRARRKRDTHPVTKATGAGSR